MKNNGKDKNYNLEENTHIKNKIIFILKIENIYIIIE